MRRRPAAARARAPRRLHPNSAFPRSPDSAHAACASHRLDDQRVGAMSAGWRARAAVAAAAARGTGRSWRRRAPGSDPCRRAPRQIRVGEDRSRKARPELARDGARRAAGRRRSAERGPAARAASGRGRAARRRSRPGVPPLSIHGSDTRTWREKRAATSAGRRRRSDAGDPSARTMSTSPITTASARSPLADITRPAAAASRRDRRRRSDPTGAAAGRRGARPTLPRTHGTPR